MNAPPPELLQARERLDQVRREVARAYMGSTRPLDLMLVAAVAKGHVLLEGVPGVAKTTLVKSMSVALGCSSRRIQFTPDLLPADITGTYVFSPKDNSFTLRPGPVFANIVLADEINRAPAKTQSALLEAMQERQVTIEGDRFELPSPFLVLATQNPIDLEGTYPLPEAQIDRFLVRIPIEYPTPRDEAAMLKAYGMDPPLVRPVLTAADLVALQNMATRIHVEEDLYDYAVGLASYTRTHARVELGASPRASLGLIVASKAWALLQGRAFVTPDDLRAMAVPVLAHRLMLSSDSSDETKTRTLVIEEALSKVGYRKAR